MPGIDGKDARGEQVFARHFCKAGINPCAHFVFIDIAGFGLFQQLAGDECSADVQRIAGHDRITGHDQGKIGLIRRRAVGTDQQFQRHVRRFSDDIDLCFQFINAQVAGSIGAFGPDPAFGFVQCRVRLRRCQCGKAQQRGAQS